MICKGEVQIMYPDTDPSLTPAQCINYETGITSVRMLKGRLCVYYCISHLSLHERVLALLYCYLMPSHESIAQDDLCGLNPQCPFLISSAEINVSMLRHLLQRCGMQKSQVGKTPKRCRENEDKREKASGGSRSNR